MAMTAPVPSTRALATSEPGSSSYLSICAFYHRHLQVELSPPCAKATACEAQRSAIGACPLREAQSELLSMIPDEGAPPLTTFRRQLMRATSGRSLLVVGDSMSRQSYFVLVSRLRGEPYPVDANTWQDISFRQFLGLPQPPGGTSRRVADSLLSLHTRSKPSKPLFRNHSQWVRKQVRDAAAAETAVDFAWAPCYDDPSWPAAAGKTLPDRAGYYSHVVIFAPTYWLLPNFLCKLPMRGPAGLLELWEPWLRSNRPATRYSIVNAPAQNVPRLHRHNASRLNTELQQLFENGSFPPNWEHVDFSALSLQLRATPVASGKNARTDSWHFVCQFATKSDKLLLNRNRSLVHMWAHADGTGCDEVANTALWKGLLLDAQPRKETASRESSM